MSDVSRQGHELEAEGRVKTCGGCASRLACKSFGCQQVRGKTCHWCSARDAVALCDEGKPICRVCNTPVVVRDEAAGEPSTSQKIVDWVGWNPGCTFADIRQAFGVEATGRRHSKGSVDVRAYNAFMSCLRHVIRCGALRYEGDAPNRYYFAVEGRLRRRGRPRKEAA